MLANLMADETLSEDPPMFSVQPAENTEDLDLQMFQFFTSKWFHIQTRASFHHLVANSFFSLVLCFVFQCKVFLITELLTKKSNLPDSQMKKT
ncbi:hypothetical protein AAFF_G00080570 [Aldrovandia affinis]|uniref:Uncharacterized protein n=1 Tax=Aldrovandia affinis TaxID=143900 RepID=A0AAD7WYC9_9TELE|nr:hypothetical protein AAFF_G00080570 [Aldrovandia affinis]